MTTEESPTADVPATRLPVREYPLEIERQQLPVKVDQYLHPEVHGISDIAPEGKLFLQAVAFGFVTPDAEGLGTLLAWQGLGRLDPTSHNGYIEWYNEARAGKEPWKSFNELLLGRYVSPENAPEVVQALASRVAALEARLTAAGV